MFDIGWPELLMVAVVLILVVGPKDLPPMLRSFGRTVKKYRGMANDFKRQFNDALDESELNELRQTVADAKSYNPLDQVTDAVKDVSADINEAVDDVKPVKPWTPKPEEISDVARSVGAKKTKAKTATARKSVAKKTAASRKTTTAATKNTAAAKTTAAKAPVVRTPAEETAAKVTAAAKKSAARSVATNKPAAKPTTAATKAPRKPRAAAAKKPTTPKGKAEAK